MNRYSFLIDYVSINVRTSDGFYVFETVPKKEVDLDIYYMDSETFEIENGFHKGKDQNQTSTTAAVSTLDFFNATQHINYQDLLNQYFLFKL